MKELQICSYEQAVRLKDAGFDWVCDMAYRLNDNELGKAGELTEYVGINIFPDIAVAPSIALALKWFRDVKKIQSSVMFFRHKTFVQYTAQLEKEERLYCCRSNYNSHEAAESALLDEILTLLEKDKK